MRSSSCLKLLLNNAGEAEQGPFTSNRWQFEVATDTGMSRPITRRLTKRNDTSRTIQSVNLSKCTENKLVRQ